MKKFKERWEIQENWQLLFPFLGLVGLGYLSYKLSKMLFRSLDHLIITGLSIPLFFVLLYITLRLFKILEKKWILTYQWEMIRVFIVFAITGSTSMFVGRPFIAFLGITQENLNPFIYWVLFCIFALIIYQFLLVSFGWLFGQFQFFWEFEKKMLKRFGLKRFLD